MMVLAAAIAVFAIAPAGASAAFGISNPSFTASNTQAAGHPDLNVAFTRTGSQSEDLSIANVELPPGAFANPEAIATKCPVATFNQDKCTDAQMVGTMSVDITAASILPMNIPGAIYVLSPNATDAATLGLVMRPAKICILLVFCAVPQKVFLQTNIKLATFDTETGLRTSTTNAPKTTTVAIPPIVSASNGLKLDITVEKMALTFQGKANKTKTGGYFMLASSSCTPSITKIQIISTAGATASPATQPRYTPTGCTSVPFTPALQFAPTVTNSGSVAGAKFTMTVPQTAAAIQQAAPKIVDVDFPTGSALNADGLVGVTGCTETQIRANSCPASSIVGTATSNAPYLPPQLTGTVYAMAPIGTSVPLGVVLNGARGSLVIFRGTLGTRGDAALGTGRVYARFDAIPQLPYADVVVNINKLLYKNPTQCGTATTTGNITGYNGTTATNGNGTVKAVTSSYTVGNCLPKPTVVFTNGPADPTTLTQPTWTFKATTSAGDLATATFECSIDGSTPSTCTSPYTQPTPLTNGPHTFTVSAYNGSQKSDAKNYPFTVNASGNFQIDPLTVTPSTTQAAAHPSLNASIGFIGGQPKSVKITLPSGFVASLAGAVKCPVADAAADACTAASLIGSGSVTVNRFDPTANGGAGGQVSSTGTGNIYLTEAQDAAADAAGVAVSFSIAGVGVFRAQAGAYLVNNAKNQLIDVRLMPNSVNGTDITVSNLTLNFNSDANGLPFLTNASSCPTTADAFSSVGKAWDGSDAAVKTVPYAATGCTGATAPAFQPTVNQAFSNLTAAANSSTVQLTDDTATVDFPAASGPIGNGTIRRMTVKEPSFLGVNFDGLGTDADQCPTSAAPGPTSTFDPTNCPAQARVGTMEITTPLLSTPITGDVYLIQASPIPWLGVKFSQPGISFSLLGVTGTPLVDPNCTPDESPTGFCNKQITIDFNNLPDTPISKVIFKVGNVGTRQGLTRVLDSRILKNSIASDASCISPQDAVSTLRSWTGATVTRNQSIVETGCTFVTP